jgi:hypothetical protein
MSSGDEKKESEDLERDDVKMPQFSGSAKATALAELFVINNNKSMGYNSEMKLECKPDAKYHSDALDALSWI